MLRYTPEPGGGPPSPATQAWVGVGVGLAVGFVWEFLRIWTDLRLGFRPPIWEIAVGWLAFSAFSGFVLLVFALAGAAIYSTTQQSQNPHSWEVRQRAAIAKWRAAAFILGSGGLAVTGGLVTWIASMLGPEFEEFNGPSRFTAFMGLIAVLVAAVYVRRDPEAG